MEIPAKTVSRTFAPYWVDNKVNSPEDSKLFPVMLPGK